MFVFYVCFVAVYFFEVANKDNKGKEEAKEKSRKEEAKEDEEAMKKTEKKRFEIY